MEPFQADGQAALTDQDFLSFQRLIHKEAGIFLGPHKKALLLGRLSRRIRELGLPSFAQYYKVVQKPEGVEERVRMLDCICTNETHFFREPHHFQFLENTVFPRWKENPGLLGAPRRIRVWSAACSTGEEPYSLAMLLHQHFPPESGFTFEIIASDLSTRVLDRARAGLWPMARSQEIPPHLLKRHMLRGVGDKAGLMKAGEDLLSLVKFHRINLNDESYPLVGPFDLIFCRNILIYFDADSKAKVIARLLSLLSRTGYFFLGHSESMNGLSTEVRNVIPTVYAFENSTRRAPVAP